MKRHIHLILFSIAILLNMLLIIKNHKLRNNYITLHKIISNKYNDTENANKILFSTKFSNIKLNPKLILTANKKLQINGNKIVLFYPENICDVCQSDIFNYFYKNVHNKEIIKNIVVLIPINSYNDFINFNNQYELNFEKIYGYDEEKKLFNNIDELKTRSFLSLDEDFIINDIFPIEKPINIKNIENYFSIIKNKYPEVRP